MDKFVVSARKYRPQNFHTVIGQQHITTTLKNAIKSKQLAHAFLFCGPRGVGKTTCARILAKTINCTNLQEDGEACNECASCKSFNDGASFNVHELDAASNNSVEDIRALVEQVRFAPQAGTHKVYIVDEVHMLSSSAFNAFLKTLEEPPPYAIFILATTEKHKILPTILSRCQIFDFKRITTNDTVEHLEEIIGKEDIRAERAALQVIAQKSEGCMRDALSILDKIASFTGGSISYQNTLEHLNILDHDYYFKLLEQLLNEDMAGAMLLYDEINRKGFEGDIVLNGFAEFIRNILVCKDARAASLLDVVEGMQAKYTNTAAGISTAYLVSALNILNEAEIHFKAARNKRLHVELVLIKLNFLQQAIEISLQADGQLVKKKRVDGPIAIKYKPVKAVQLVQPQHKQEAALHIHQPKAFQPAIPPAPSATIAAPKAAKPAADSSSSSNAIAKDLTGKKLLDIIKQKHGDAYQLTDIKEAEPLSTNRLTDVWQQYSNQLLAANKQSAAAALSGARLELMSETEFAIYTESITQSKFIESEKMLLADHLQTHFNNRHIHFRIVVEEGEIEELPAHITMNKRQKYALLAQQYPLLEELKNKLKLQLDY
jgi:DNA polymerase III subunit gamma/tau